MSVQNGERLATKQDLADLYSGILPYLGGMPEVLANKFSKGDLYDTSEKMIGKWVDNKPLYQKVFDLGTLSASPVTIDITSLNVDSWVNAWGMASIYENNTDGGAIFIPTYSDTGFNYNIYFKSSMARNTLVLYYTKGNSSYNFRNCKVVFQYTKTTDSADSFNIGESTDYSTTEKIVGTWLNGEPLYQRVMHNVSYSANSNWEVLDNSVSYGTLILCDLINNAEYQACHLNNISGKPRFCIYNNALMFYDDSAKSNVDLILQYTKSNS